MLWIKQTDGWGLCFDDQYESVWSPANFKEELPAPKEALIKAGCDKNVGKERKVKTPIQNRSARGRRKSKAIKSSKGRAQSAVARKK